MEHNNELGAANNGRAWPRPPDGPLSSRHINNVMQVYRNAHQTRLRIELTTLIANIYLADSGGGRGGAAGASCPPYRKTGGAKHVFLSLQTEACEKKITA